MTGGKNKEQPKGKHGGTRAGAGRPPKFGFLFKLKVGGRCEALSREAKEVAWRKRLSVLTTEASDIRSYWEKSKKIAPHERAEWLQSDRSEWHFEDIAIERAAILAELYPLDPNDDNGDVYPPIGGGLLVTVDAKPLWGTRKSILAQVADEFSLSIKQVEKMWGTYREFEKETDQFSAPSEQKFPKT